MPYWNIILHVSLYITKFYRPDGSVGIKEESEELSSRLEEEVAPEEENEEEAERRRMRARLRRMEIEMNEAQGEEEEGDEDDEVSILRFS